MSEHKQQENDSDQVRQNRGFVPKRGATVLLSHGHGLDISLTPETTDCIFMQSHQESYQPLTGNLQKGSKS